MEARRAETAARLKSAERNFKNYQSTLLAKLRQPGREADAKEGDLPN